MDALIGSTTDRGHTLVVVTHDEGVAARCGRTVRLRDGRIVQTSTKVGTDGEMAYIETAATDMQAGTAEQTTAGQAK
jgi:putative ABC transport system ATP-binding protein